MLFIFKLQSLLPINYNIYINLQFVSSIDVSDTNILRHMDEEKHDQIGQRTFSRIIRTTCVCHCPLNIIHGNRHVYDVSQNILASRLVFICLCKFYLCLFTSSIQPPIHGKSPNHYVIQFCVTNYLSSIYVYIFVYTYITF